MIIESAAAAARDLVAPAACRRQMPPKGLSQAKRQRLQARDADTKADSIAEGLSTIGEIAIEREVEMLNAHLRKKPALLYTLSSCIRDGTLEALLTGGLPSKPPPQKVSKDALKPKQKKWKNMSEKQMKVICLHLMPDWSEQELPQRHTWTEIGCAMLGVKGNDNLPFDVFPWCSTMTELLKASKMRWDILGKRFEGKNLNDLYGLWRIDGQRVECAFDSEKVAVPMGGQATEVEISDVWDFEATIRVAAPFGTGRFSLFEVFDTANVKPFELQGDGGVWELPDYQEPDPDSGDDDDGAASVSSIASASSSGIARPKASPSMLSAALRARLQGSGSSASGSVPPPP